MQTPRKNDNTIKRARSPSPAVKSRKSSQKSKDKAASTSQPAISTAVKSMKGKSVRSPSPAPKSDTGKKFGTVTKDSKTKSPKEPQAEKKFAVEDILEPVKPKKPTTSYIFFNKSQMKKAEPKTNAEFTAITKESGEAWKTMTDKEKLPYVKLA